MQRYKIKISYDGTNYSGWQVQKNAPTIQPIIQNAIETVLRHEIQLTGSGRTDAGVHALGQIAHFDSPIIIQPERFLLSINALLPFEIRVLQVEKVDKDFHSRYSAKSKIYHYHLHLDKVLNPFVRKYVYHVVVPCDLHLLKMAIPQFLGTHDFSSFANQPHKGTASYDPIRTISRIDCIDEPGGVRLEFEADGFLYQMVRNITGTLLDIGRKQMLASDIPHILKSKDRKKAGSAAPPIGLFLVEVKY